MAGNLPVCDRGVGRQIVKWVSILERFCKALWEDCGRLDRSGERQLEAWRTDNRETACNTRVGLLCLERWRRGG